MADQIPVVITSTGVQPTPPAVLLANLIAAVSAVTPGYTANLPGSMIEDMSSTEVGGLAEIDSARVETLNSITPYGANEFVLAQQGQIYIGPGAAPGVPTNTSVSITVQATDVSASPLAGYVVPIGFTVSDGIYQYVAQDSGITGSDGFTDPIFCLATVAGSWAVPPNSVSQVVTQAPSNVVLTCTNELAGLSGGPAETAAQYRARVLQAGQAIAQGMTTMLKTLLANVPGVQSRLISVQQQNPGWVVIVGGGDPYAVANAIFTALFDISSLVISPLPVTNITQAANGVVTTSLNHGLTTGATEVISDVVGMTTINGVPFTVEVVNANQFKTGINTLGFPAYVSGGIVSPNPRNKAINIIDYPDIYTINFVDPPQQTVTMVATYGTTAENFVSQAAIAQLAAPALAAYVNSIIVGAPINLLVAESVFLAAIASVLDPSQISVLTFAVSINGISTPPEVDTSLVFGDAQSYFTTTTAAITIAEA